MLMIFLAACGNETSTGGEERKPEIEENQKESAEEATQKEEVDTPELLAKKAAESEVELVFAGASRPKEDEFMGSMGGAQFQKKFPNYKITFKEGTVQDLISVNETIDIFHSSVGLTPATLLAVNLQSDISDMIQKYNYDLTRLEQSTIEIQRDLAGGGIYGLPVNTISGALFYNKDLFDRFGVGAPTDGMTWDEVYDLARTMSRTEGGQSYRGLTIAFQHMMFLNQLSAPHLDPVTNKALFMEDRFIQAFENLARFYKITGNELTNNKFSLPDQQNPFFKEQTIAMLITLSGGGAGLGDMNWDMVHMPVFKEQPEIGPQSYPAYLYITSTSKHRDEAFQVLSYATSDEFQEWQAMNGVPSILNDQSKLMEKFGVNQPLYEGKNLKAILPNQFASPTMKTRYQGIADAEVLAALGEYSAGKDLNSALRDAAERANQRIAAEAAK